MDPRAEQAVLAALRGAVDGGPGAPDDLAVRRREFFARRVPPVAGRARGPVRRAVEIVTDRWGIPHVFAENAWDLFLAFGFAVARERLWQLDYRRRAAAGTLAEVLGRGALRRDVEARTLDFRGIAAQEWARQSGEAREALEAYAAGVNLAREQCLAQGALPVEFALLEYEPAPWHPLDSLTIARASVWQFSGRIEGIVLAEAARRYLPPHLAELFLAVEAPEQVIAAEPVSPGADPAGAGSGPGPARPRPRRSPPSRGRRTASPAATSLPPGRPAPGGEAGAGQRWARPLHAAVQPVRGPPLRRGVRRDRHRPAGAAGAAERAQPARRLGQHQQRLLRARPVRGDGRAPGPRALPGRRRLAPLRHPAGDDPRAGGGGPPAGGARHGARAGGQPPASPASIRRAIRRSACAGWASRPRTPSAWRSTCCGPASAEAYRAIQARHALAASNPGFADVDGHFGYQMRGRVPLRGRVTGGYRHAGAAQDEWQGFVPFEHLPAERDPARGWTGSANNRPAPDGYPVPLYGSYADGYRMRRIRALLDGARELGADDLGRMQYDTFSGRAADVCPHLVALLEARPAGHRRRNGGRAGGAGRAAALGLPLRRRPHRGLACSRRSGWPGRAAWPGPASRPTWRGRRRRAAPTRRTASSPRATAPPGASRGSPWGRRRRRSKPPSRRAWPGCPGGWGRTRRGGPGGRCTR